MFDAFLALDLLIALLAPIAWLFAGFGVGRLSRIRTLRQFRRGTTLALVFLAIAELLALAAVLVALGYWLGSGWWAAWDRVLVTLPAVLLPAIAALVVTVPAMLRRRREAAGDPLAPASPALLARAASQAIVLPAQAAAVGAFTAAWFTWFKRPVDSTLVSSMVITAVLSIGISAALWARQRARARALLGGARQAGPGTRLVRAAVVLVAVTVGTIGAWTGAAASSRLPDRINMSAHGPMDFGGGAALPHDGHPEVGIPVTDLREQDQSAPDRRFTLTARKATIKLSSGATVQALTFDGKAPGPELRVRQGDLVEVTLLNQDIEDGVTIHWHGIDLPNAADGVAGVTQDAVLPGKRYTYRFRAEQIGTFWYHSHQRSADQVRAGLFGAIVIEPRQAPAEPVEDLAVVIHDWPVGGQAPRGGDGNGDGDGFGGTTAFNAADTLQRRKIAPGTPVRLRLVNADSITRSLTLAGTPFKLAAIDGTDLNQPGELNGQALSLAGGGRYDLTFTMPATSVLLSSGGERAGAAGEPGLLLSADGGGELPPPATGPVLDPIGYGEPGPAPFGASSDFDREFAVTFDIAMGFYDGEPVGAWRINGEVFPRVPMQMVREGDLVKVTLVNRSFAPHPFHLHGHHMLVLSRNGTPASGSPWWSDTLDVGPGERYEVAFRADNPGIWMDHCHNLEHATTGMTMHLAYEGVTTPFAVGDATTNHPE
jgi:FtsP/CotA-like multicopper oxidase with cupredoxin domain